MQVTSRLHNGTGEKIVGGLLGAGEAGRDALAGAWNMVRHPINTIEGAAKLGTLEGQVEAGLNVTSNYLQSKSDYGEGFTDARYISYGVTTIGIAVFGTEGVGMIKNAEIAEVAEEAQFTKSSLKLGQKMHKVYKVGADGIKEFRLPSGKRIDFLDIKNRTIYELKPNNPRAIKTGLTQLQKYKAELEAMPRFKGVNWKTVLDTY